MKISRHRFAALLAAALMAATAALPVQASPHGARHAEGGMMLMGRGMDRMLDAVNASDEQRSQIRRITDTARDELRAQREAGRGLHDQMRELFTQPTVDANVAESLRKQMLAQHDRQSQRVMQAMIEVSRVLTPEQRQQIAAKMQQRREHRHERRGDRRPG